MDGIPLWLPPSLCIICSICSGLTSFGDAILFQVLWSCAAASGLIPDNRASLIVATSVTSLQGLSNLPIMLVQARKQLWTATPYGLVAGAFGSMAVPVGASLLYYSGDLATLKICIGVFFLFFSVVKLTSAARSAGLRRVSAGNFSQLAEGKSNETDDGLEHGEATTNAPFPPPPAAPPNASGALEPPAWVPARLRPYLTLGRISPSASVPATFGGLACAGVGAGLLGSMWGTGGPPQMVAYSMLGVDKDYIRAVSAAYSVLELATRIWVYATEAASPFRAGDWPIYVAILLCSWTGFGIGSALRAHADTDAIIRMLLALVFASSSILLGALDSAGVAAAFAVGSVAWVGLLVALVLRPAWFDGVAGLLTWRKPAAPVATSSSDSVTAPAEGPSAT